MTGTRYRIDPALPVCWEGPDALRVGFEPPYASIPHPSPGVQRLVGAFRAGLPLAPDGRRLRRYGVTAADWRRVVERLAPILVECGRPEDPPGAHRPDRSGSRRAGALLIALPGTGIAHERIGEALSRAGHRVRESQPGGSSRIGPEPDLLIAVERFVGVPDPGLVLLSERLPRLTVRFTDRGFWLGPLTEPAGSPCARCATEHGVDADPALPLVAAQLLDRTPAAETPPAAAAAAELAVAAIRRWQRGDGSLASTRLRVGVTSGLPELASVPHPLAPHPECPCRGPARGESARAARPDRAAQPAAGIPASARKLEGTR